MFFLLAKKTSTSYQRSKFTQVKESLNAAEQFDNVDEQTSTDEEEIMASVTIDIIFFFRTISYLNPRFILLQNRVNYN